MTDDALRAYLQARGLDETSPHIDDLRLAHDCLRGDERALAAFDARHRAVVLRALASFTVAHEDVWQRVLERLFVGGKLALYRGEGELNAWLRVVATREALAMSGRAREEEPDDVLAMVEFGEDPALDVFRRRHEDDFRAALRDALQALQPRQRTLLKMSVTERLKPHEIGRVYGVHRTTAMRWLDEAQAALISETRRLLAERLKLDRWQLLSLLRWLPNQLAISLPTIDG